MSHDHVADESDAPEQPAYSETLTWNQVRRPFALTVIAAVALVLAGLIGVWSATPQRPSTTSVDAGFARDMTAHHDQAVDMSMRMRSRSTASDIQVLTSDVIRTQENQRGQMMGWLTMWGLPLAVSGPRMQWMAQTGHHHAGLPKGQMLLADGRMPGLASKDQLAQLDSAHGKDAEILYLRLMIVHHRAGVEMAKAAVAGARQPQVVALARSIVTGQESEISLMTSMLAQRGATPWSDAQAGQR